MLVFVAGRIKVKLAETHQLTPVQLPKTACPRRCPRVLMLSHRRWHDGCKSALFFFGEGAQTSFNLRIRGYCVVPGLLVGSAGRRACGEQCVANNLFWYRLVAEVTHAAARAHGGVELSAGIDHSGVALGLVRKGYFLNSHKLRAAAWIRIATLPEI